MIKSSGLWMAAVVLAGGCGVPAYSRYPLEEEIRAPAGRFPLSVEDVTKLTRAGIGDEIILTKIRSDGVLSRPSSDQVVALKKEGVSDRVIEALLTGRLAAEPVDVPPRVIHRYDWRPAWYWEPWFGWCWPWPWWHFGWTWRVRP